MSDEPKYRINRLQSFHIDAATPETGWKAVQGECAFLSDWGVEKLRDGLDGHVQSIVLEPLYMCKDHRNLYSNFYSKKFLEVTSNCSRLHFFNMPTVEPKALLATPEKFQSGYMGFSVIRPVKTRCLGRTVIDPWKIGKGIPEHCYVLRAPFKTHINGTEFQVRGYPFTAQDADATLCAHSALWGVCRYLSEKYTYYRELYPFDFIRMTESSKGRAFPYRGMSRPDYCKILADFGTTPVYGDLLKRESATNTYRFDGEVYKDLCSYVESGFPVLASLVLPAGAHVVSLVGHTLDFKRALSSKSAFIDSSEFWEQLIVVDDNFFPYQFLGRSGDATSYARAYDEGNVQVGIENIVTMTCPLAEKVFVPAERARRKALKHCEKFLSNLKLTGSEPFVTRLFVTNSSSFKKRKLACARTGLDRASSLVVNLHLPHFVWIMEVSPVALYQKGVCTAEIVLDATAGHEEEGMIYIRIGKHLYFATETKTVWSEIEGALAEFPQYTHNLGEKAAA